MLISISKLMFKWVNFDENYGRNTIVSFLKNSQFNSVLDIGAGHGEDLMRIKGINHNLSLNAIECYLPYIKQLKEKGVKVANIDIEHDVFPYNDESIDVVICNQVLEHTKEIFWVLHEISRVLRKDGLFIIGVPNLVAWHNRMIVLIGITPPCIELGGNHVRGFSKKDIHHLLVKRSKIYKEIDYKGVGFYPFKGIVAKLFAKLFPSMAWGIFLSFRKQCEYNEQFITEAKIRVETKFYIGDQ